VSLYTTASHSTLKVLRTTVKSGAVVWSEPEEDSASDVHRFCRPPTVVKSRERALAEKQLAAHVVVCRTKQLVCVFFDAGGRQNVFIINVIWAQFI